MMCLGKSQSFRCRWGTNIMFKVNWFDLVRPKARLKLTYCSETLMSSVGAGFGGAPCLTAPSLPLRLCRFNYRSTHHLTTNGFYEFLNWFDERAWYPLGRIVGGTVSVSYCMLCMLCVCEGKGLCKCVLSVPKLSLSLFLKSHITVINPQLSS